MSQSNRSAMEEVLAANERFYAALSRLDLAGMDQVWADDGQVRCIHPGWDVVVGSRAVRESWQAIFSASPGLSVECDEVEIHIFGDLAWVHCMERIFSSGEGDEGPSFARSTNLFIRKGDAWRMILHHASPIPAPEESAPIAIH